jgi:hypothetical protein
MMMQVTPVIVNSYDVANTMPILKDAVESLPDSNTILVNKIRLKMLLSMPNAEVYRSTSPVLIPAVAPSF